jgi:hypothetical protein
MADGGSQATAVGASPRFEFDGVSIAGPSRKRDICFERPKERLDVLTFWVLSLVGAQGML